MRKLQLTNDRGGWIALAGAAFLIACSDSTVDPPLDPIFESAIVTPAAANVNSARIDVDATGYDSVAFALRTAGEAPERSAAYPFAGGTAVGSALGMLAGRSYEIDVILFAGADADTVETITLVTDSLPAWLPEVVPVGTGAEDGFIGLAHPEGPVIIDNAGRIRWYLARPDSNLVNFQAHPSGEYTVFGRNDADRFYRVFNERGEEVRTVGCVGLETRFHDVRILADGDAFVLCNDPQPTDLSARGGSATGVVEWNSLQRVTPAGQVAFQFNTREHFSLDDIDPDVFTGAESVNIVHGNGIAIEADGDLILSWRSLNEITKIDGQDGSVTWRLGGLANQFTITDPVRAFERQHGLRVVEPGLIQFLDNGTMSPSRLVRYEIDETAMTADLVWDFADAMNAFSPIGGSTEVLPGGGGLVSFGTAGRVDEVDANGVATLELTGLEGTYIFRAFRIPSLYGSRW
ncbi:MAG: arylsulfotransferase family protein [Gemmatimonadota bacterium]